jgi:hypothetical protein
VGKHLFDPKQIEGILNKSLVDFAEKLIAWYVTKPFNPRRIHVVVFHVFDSRAFLTHDDIALVRCLLS